MLSLFTGKKSPDYEELKTAVRSKYISFGIARGVVKKIIDKFSGKKVSQKMRAYPESENKYYEIHPDDYLFAVFQTIEQIVKVSKDFPPLTELLYYIVDSETSNQGENRLHKYCTGEIRLITVPGVLQIETKKGKFQAGTLKFREWMAEYVNRLEAGCKFNSLIVNAVGIEGKDMSGYGHRNIIFSYITEPDKEGKKKVYLSVYEPHGSDLDYFSMSHYGGIDRLLEQMIGYINTTTDYQAELIPRKMTSCPAGPQSMDTTIGFCIMYSFFWLYCLLHVMNVEKDDRIEDFPYLISNIDRLIMSDPKKVPVAIYNFTVYMVNSYLENISPNLQARFVQKLNDNFFLRIQAEMIPVKENKMVRQPPISLKRKREIEQEASSPYTRRKTELSCDINAECASDLCVRGKCVDFNDYYGGKECKENSECISNSCVAGACQAHEDAESTGDDGNNEEEN